MAEGFLSDLVGVHDVMDSAGIVLPRRNTLSVIGADVRDDAAAGQTIITLRNDHVIEQLSPGGNLTLTNTDADVYRIATPVTVYGMGVPSAGGRQRVWIINASSGSLTVEHQSGLAPAATRIISPTSSSVILGIGAVLLLIYDATTGRWRLAAV